MKKIIFGLFAILALTFTSCKDEAGLPEPGAPVDVAGECSGTYVGTWSYYATSAPDDVFSYDGSLTLAKRGDENYVVSVVANCSHLEATPLDANNPWPLVAAANINPAYVFFNAVKTPFGNDFSGKITDKKDVTMSFTQSFKIGRKQYVYSFSFVGTKQ